jgi:hypothetical protein
MVARQFVRFLAVGLLNTAFGYAVFAVAILAGLGSMLSLVLAYVFGITFNFFTTGRFVFRDKRLSVFARFVAAYGVIYAFNVALFRLVEGFGRAAPGPGFVPSGGGHVLVRALQAAGVQEPGPRGRGAPVIGVALLTKNGGARLTECLDALAAQQPRSRSSSRSIPDRPTATLERLQSHPARASCAWPPGSSSMAARATWRCASRARRSSPSSPRMPFPRTRAGSRRFERFMDAHPRSRRFRAPGAASDADPLEAFEVAGHFESFRGGPETFARPADFDRRARCTSARACTTFPT